MFLSNFDWDHFEILLSRKRSYCGSKLEQENPCEMKDWVKWAKEGLLEVMDGALLEQKAW